MNEAEEGLTRTYRRVHDPADTTAAIKVLRELHTRLDLAVRDAYGWADLALNHDFYETSQGTRWTIGPEARVEVLDRLLEENHRRYAPDKSETHKARRPGRPRAAKAMATPVGQGTIDWGANQ